MAWLADIAGKAEGFLNQIDKGAATALQSPRSIHGGKGTPPPNRHRPPSPTISEPSIKSDYMTPKEHIGSYAASDIQPRRERSSGYASSVSSMSRGNAKDVEDTEKLLEYLNQEPSSGTPKHDLGKPMGHSRRSSASSLKSLPAQLFLQHSEEGPPLDQSLPTVSYDQAMESNQTSAAKAFQSRLEREVIELKARETDLVKALQAKDSQLAVLRVRIQEVDLQMESKSKILAELKTEKDRLLRDTADSTEIRNKALGTMQQQLQTAEAELEREKQSAKRAEAEYMTRLHTLEEESSALARQLTDLQKNMTDEKLREKDTADQLRLAKYNLEANKKEFDEYKQKAQRILQAKEKLIETLKEGGAGRTEGEEGSLAVEIEELRSERDILKEDYQQSQLHVYNLKAEIQEIESQLAAEQRTSLEQQRNLQEQCQTHQNAARQSQEQLEHLKMEYQFIQDELRRQQVTLQTKLQEKDAEIFRLMNQNTARSINVSSNGDYEQRIRHLTENLIQKQTTIESLQTEKHSIALQLERVERMYREAESAAMRASSTSIQIEEGSVSSRIPSFMRETPFDTSVARGVKKAYGTVDVLSVKVGVFLRRYPMARVAVFVYMLLLHVWVMVVLLTYTPEIHPMGYHDERPPGAGTGKQG